MQQWCGVVVGAGGGRMGMQAGAWWFVWMVVGGAAIVGGTSGAARLLLTAVTCQRDKVTNTQKYRKQNTVWVWMDGTWLGATMALL
jgi:hypothetical protein